MVAHNGEINTVKGNFNWMRAREGVMKSPVLGRRPEEAVPHQLLSRPVRHRHLRQHARAADHGGYPLAHAAMMMIPEAWEQHSVMEERRRAFYEYHAP